MTNCYKILGVKDFAPAEEIKTAYRKLSKKFHPDVNDGDKFFEERFKELQNAYETLTDQRQKDIHDANLRRSFTGSGNPDFRNRPRENENANTKANTSNNAGTGNGNWQQSQTKTERGNKKKQAPFSQPKKREESSPYLFVAAGVLLFLIMVIVKAIQR